MDTFRAKKIENKFVQQIQAPSSRVFPLLCPVREYDWIEPWQCEMLNSVSGIAEKNCVFRTNPPGESPDVWVISNYEPNKRIEFIRTNALRTMWLSITLADNGDDTTSAVNEQLLVGLNEQGNQALDKMSDGFFFEMRMGEAMLNHYLITGQRLPLQDAIALASKQK
jgi:hypothetical protein